MFHVLAGNAIVLKKWPEEEATQILCDTRTPRCAISKAEFDKLMHSGKLNDNRICKVCRRFAQK